MLIVSTCILNNVSTENKTSHSCMAVPYVLCSKLAAGTTQLHKRPLYKQKHVSGLYAHSSACDSHIYAEHSLESTGRVSLASR